MKNEALKCVSRLLKAAKYDEALEALKALPLDFADSLLVKKGMVLQLATNHPDIKLDEIEESFKQALRINPENVEALLEFGWFQLNVCDDPISAKRFFKKANRIARRQIEESMAGLHDVAEDLRAKE